MENKLRIKFSLNVLLSEKLQNKYKNPPFLHKVMYVLSRTTQTQLPSFTFMASNYRGLWLCPFDHDHFPEITSTERVEEYDQCIYYAPLPPLLKCPPSTICAIFLWYRTLEFCPYKPLSAEPECTVLVSFDMQKIWWQPFILPEHPFFFY